MRSRPEESKTEIDPRIGKSVFAINLQAFPDVECLDSLSNIQSKLEKQFPKGCYRVPEQALHLTVCPIIWARDDHDSNPESTWMNKSADVLKEVAELLSTTGAFTLALRSVETRPTAIMMCASHSDTLNSLRHNLAMILDKHSLNATVPSLIHVTLFRFTASLPFDRIAELVSRVQLPTIRWTIDRLVLSQETLYPSIRRIDIEAHDLVR